MTDSYNSHKTTTGEMNNKSQKATTTKPTDTICVTLCPFQNTQTLCIFAKELSAGENKTEEIMKNEYTNRFSIK